LQILGLPYTNTLACLSRASVLKEKKLTPAFNSVSAKMGEKHFESKNKNGRTDVDITICFFVTNNAAK
jgi:hypothetical protein